MISQTFVSLTLHPTLWSKSSIATATESLWLTGIKNRIWMILFRCAVKSALQPQISVSTRNQNEVSRKKWVHSMTLIVLPAYRPMFGHTPRWSRNFLKILSCFCRVTWKSKILSIFHKKILHKTMCSRIFLWKNIQNFRFSSHSTEKRKHFQIISRPLRGMTEHSSTNW